MRNAVIAVSSALLAIQCCIAESAERSVYELSTVFAAENPSLAPGGFSFAHRLVVFPAGCRYLSHDVELLDRVPELGPSDYSGISDALRKSHPEDALFDRLSIHIGAHRPRSLPKGPASIKVKVRISAECDEEALAKLVKESGLELGH